MSRLRVLLPSLLAVCAIAALPPAALAAPSATTAAPPTASTTPAATATNTTAASTPTTPLRATPVEPTTLPTVWACFPGAAANPCEASQRTTVLASGQKQLRKVARVDDDPLPTDPPVDCFYVYPTVTSALGSNAPRRIDADVRAVIDAQASRFSSQCRVFAPVYRQASIVSVGQSVLTKQTTTSAAQDLAYSDVLGAWRDYLAHDNHGRGVMLIGHSQGSGMLIRLMTQEMDANPAQRDLLVGAILPGANLAVKKGERLGGNFATIPTCESVGEAGCAVAFSTYNAQPSQASYFGRIGVLSAAFGGPQGDAYEVACTNPAELSGDDGVLQPLLRSALQPGVNGLLEATFWNGLRPTAKTPWVLPGGRLTTACVSENGANVLRLSVGPTNLQPVALPTAEWGLHIGEMELTLGNLVRIVHLQSQTWLAAHAA